MPKKSKGKKGKTPVKRSQAKTVKPRSKVHYDESDIEYDDEIDKFHAQRDKIPLDSDGEGGISGAEEEEVLSVVSDSSDEEIQFYQKQLQDMRRAGLIKQKLGSDSEEQSDKEEEEETGMPSRLAWGDKRRAYYGGDVRDAKIGLGHEDKQGAALMEEKEAMEIQRHQRARYTEDDLALDTVFAALESSEEENEVTVRKTRKAITKGKKILNKKKTDFGPLTNANNVFTNIQTIHKDLSKLSEKEQMEILRKESPEFIPLYLEMFEVAETTSRLSRLYIALKESGNLTNDGACKYLNMKLRVGHLLLMNTLVYISMKADKIPTQNHPVIERIYQFRQSWKAFESLDGYYQSQIEKALEQLENGLEVSFMQSLKCQTQNLDKRKRENEEGKKSKKVKVAGDLIDGLNKISKEKSIPVSAGDISRNLAADAEDSSEGEDDQRAITQEMEKNRGLKAYRKKSLTHSRVKHREKYRKAKIRRKGQVREVRAETTRYRGEHSGIRAGVVRSRRL